MSGKTTGVTVETYTSCTNPASQFKGQFSAVRVAKDIRDNGILVDSYTQNLALPVYSDDTVRSIVRSRNEDLLARDSVHIDAYPGFEVIEVNEAVSCHQVKNPVFFRNLDSNWEIADGLWMELNVCRLFYKPGIWILMVDFHNVKLDGTNHQSTGAQLNADIPWYQQQSGQQR